jgi:tetratricopeptide (TPR) repeat protein
MNIGGLHNVRGRHGEALHHVLSAMPLYEAADHRVGLARATTNVGWCHAQTGDHAAALRHCRRALELQQAIGDTQGEADAWEALGFVYQRLRRYEDADQCLRIGLELARGIGDRYREAELLLRLGDGARAGYQDNRARAYWRRAAAVLDDLGHPQAERVRARLDQVGAARNP